MSRSFRFLSLVLVLLSMGAAAACSGSGRFETDTDRRLDWWREARFGLFIHWGLYAIPAGEWGGGTDHAEWIRTTAQIPIEVYDRFTGQFNPVRFDADAWVQMAKDAGMKYIVITSKHHDGFCLFDSELTDFDVMSTPFGRDIMAELAAACRRHGLRMCWYHSIMDWHHPDYLPRRGWEQDTRGVGGADFDRYVEYLHGQVTELLTRYGPIGIMWFDGEWESTWTHEYGQPLYDLCLELQPDVIVNNRVDSGRSGMAGMTEGIESAGDYGTPEQQIPATGLPGVDWETCMTMNRHWGYNRADSDYKSVATLVRMLVDIASKGGNFLLNVGPTAEGLFPPESVERLAGIGRWMDDNSEAIYGTDASPFAGLPWGRCTVKTAGRRTSLYLHVFDWPADGRLIVPGIGNVPIRARLLAGERTRLPVGREGSDLHIDLPDLAPDPICSVVVLEVRGEPVVYEAPAIRAEAAILVNSLAVELTTRSSDLEIRYTLDGTDPDETAAVYSGPVTIDRTTVVKARSFHEGRPVSALTETAFTRVTPVPAVQVGATVPGLRRETFYGDWDVLPDFDTLRPESRTSSANLTLGRSGRVEYVGYRFSGFIEVAADDVYRFALASDDGSRLRIDDRLVDDHAGLHGPATQTGEIALAAGRHRLVVEWFNKTGGAELGLRFAPVGGTPGPVPEGAFSHRP